MNYALLLQLNISKFVCDIFQMDFPNKAFPYQLYERVSRKTPDGYTHTSMREPFSSYGTHGNIDVEDISEKRFYPQKIPEGFVQSTNTWKPSRPTLPLYSSPELGW